jgi:DNA-directed RNA polymerase subunit RPC12/RpoP
VGRKLVRFDYACKKCEKTFTIWSDDALACPLCRSKRVFKIFLTPPAASTGNAAAVDKLAEHQLEAAGLSNYTNAGGTIRRTRKTDPKQLEAVAAAKSANVPFDMRAPIVTGPAPKGNIPIPQVARLAQSFNQGKSKVTSNPRGQGALVNNVLQRGRQLNPLSARTIYRTHADAKNDMVKVQSLIKR